MKRTITIDTDLVKVVPLNPTQEILDACAEEYDEYNKLNYIWMLAAVPDNLPGVAVHSGEPAAFETYKGYLLHAGDPKVLEHSDPTPLFTHPPAQPGTEALQARIADLENYLVLAEQGQPAMRDEITFLKVQLAAQAADTVEMLDLLKQIALNTEYVHGFHLLINTLQPRLSAILDRLAPEVGTELVSRHDWYEDDAAQALPLENDGMHASIFVKVWGDAGGGDAGRIALANYAYSLGLNAVQAGAEILLWPRHDIEQAPVKQLLTFDNGIQLPIVKDGDGFVIHPDYLKVTFTPAPANSVAIVQATLEAAAHSIELRQETFTTVGDAEENTRHVTDRKHGNLSGLAYADAIRAIDPQTILDGVGK